MAFALNIGDNIYLGTLSLAGATPVKPGVFVVPNWANGTAAIADATTGDGDVYIVANEIDTVPEQGINDLDFTVAVGEKLKLKKLQVGDIFTVTEFNGAPNVGDVLAVGANGKLEAIGSRTPKQSFTVIDKPVLWGVPCIKCVVNQN